MRYNLSNQNIKLLTYEFESEGFSMGKKNTVPTIEQKN
jgi:hypothetical protein